MWLDTRPGRNPDMGSSKRTIAVKNRVIAIASILTLIGASAAFAGDIYKWTDADGSIHYGDRPSGEQPVVVAIASRPTDSAQIQADARDRAESRALANEAKAAAAAERPTAAELKAEAAERAQKCAGVKAQMQQLITSRRLYREDNNGERVYLDESETAAARERVENQISEFCGS